MAQGDSKKHQIPNVSRKKAMKNMMLQNVVAFACLAFGVWAVKAKGGEDAFTHTPECQWFYAPDHLGDLQQFCQTWTGGTYLNCLDMFSASMKVANTFRKNKYNMFKAVAFDIKTNPSEDILTQSGFMDALALGMSFLAMYLQFCFDLCAPSHIFHHFSNENHCFGLFR